MTELTEAPLSQSFKQVNLRFFGVGRCMVFLEPHDRMPSMTVTKTYRAEMSDVVAIRLVCSSCHASVSIPPNDQWNLREHCPNCPVDWLPRQAIEYALVHDLIKPVVALRGLKKEAACRVSLEFNLPES
jgi:hypothetical protein